MTKDRIEDQLMPITCAKCGRQVEKPIKWIRRNSSLQCEGCEFDIDLESEEFIFRLIRFTFTISTPTPSEPLTHRLTLPLATF